MRIISGSARGVPLDALDRPSLRPMLDRVKESLFNIVRELVPGARVLDLFSGSGALGLEALSRGAGSCVFVERDPALVRLIESNAAKCKLREGAHIVQANVLNLPGRPPPPTVAPCGLAFVDPPYAMVEDPNRRAELFDALESLLGAWVAPHALLVLHHSPLPYALWPTRGLVETDKRIYGNSQLTFFDVAGEGADG